MKSKFDNKAWDQGTAESVKESHARKEDAGGIYKTIFKDDAPKEKMIKKFAEDEHQINIIPYIAGAFDPIHSEGKIVHYVEVPVHTNIGPTKDSYICLARAYKKACPVCEYQAKLREDGEDNDIVNAFYPKRRMIYNVEVIDSPKEQAKGVQIFEVAQFSFSKPLDEAAELPKGGGVVNYAGKTVGKTISFKVKGGTFKDKKTGKTGNKVDYTSFHFLDREPLTDELLESAHCLDELFYIPTYEEVYKALHQEEPESTVVRSEEEETIRHEDNEDVPPFEPDVKEEATEELPTECIFEGVEFGKQFDEFEDCNTCEIRLYCEDKQKALLEAAKPKTKAPAPKTKEPETTGPRRRPGR